MQYTTSKVIKKHNKTEKVYCNIGDKLKVISDHLGVLIVETKSGYRFSLKTEETDYESSKK